MKNVHRFVHDHGEDDGSVAIIFAMVAFVLVGSIGMVLDYSRASDLRTRLQAAADAGVLNALNPINNYSDRETYAKAAFQAILSNEESASVDAVTTSLRRDASGVPDRLTLNFEALSSNTLSQVLGIPGINVRGSATAEIALGARNRLHFLIDTSDSMGIAATESDRSALRKLTDRGDGGCEFACHTAQDTASPPPYLQIARDNKITLRVDIARQGAERVIQFAREQSPGTNFTYSLHAMSDILTTVTPSTSDFGAFQRALRTIEVGYGHTDGSNANSSHESILPRMATWLDNTGAQGGDDVVFLITDGVRSVYQGGMPEVRAISPGYCDALKRDNRLLAVIYTEYLPLTASTIYMDTVANFRHQLEPNLRACASSPELYARGSTPGEIFQAFERVFVKTVRKHVRLVL